MVYTVRISKKGTITIPASIRKAFALKPGQKVRQWLEGDKIILDFGKGVRMSIRSEQK